MAWHVGENWRAAERKSSSTVSIRLRAGLASKRGTVFPSRSTLWERECLLRQGPCFRMKGLWECVLFEEWIAVLLIISLRRRLVASSRIFLPFLTVAVYVMFGPQKKRGYSHRK